jgi:hypothetical protein
MEGVILLIIFLLAANMVRVAYQRYCRWEARRNELPDEDRARLFWNDRNYERLGSGLNALWWVLAVLVVAPIIWSLGATNEWWCWPFHC